MFYLIAYYENKLIFNNSFIINFYKNVANYQFFWNLMLRINLKFLFRDQSQFSSKYW